MKNTFNLTTGFLIIFSLLFSFTFCSAQTSTNHSITNLDANQQAFNSSDGVFSITGTRVGNKNSPIENDALLYPGWMKGIVNFTNGKQFKDALLEFNIVKNELYFNNENKPNLFAEAVNSFYIIDTLNGLPRKAFFKNGYPAFENRDDKTFYLVMYPGPSVQLLRLISKKIRESYEYGSAGKAVYEIKEQLFVYDAKANSLKPIKNSVTSLSKALPAYSFIIQDILKNKNKNLSDEEMIGAISELNTKIK